MTMHLVGPYLTTTNTNRRNKKKNAKTQKAIQEHEEWLKKKGVGKTALPVDKKGRRVGIYDIPDYNTGPRMTSDNIAGSGVAKQPKIYTGDEIVGIATMHKSNAVPIRKDNKQAAIDVSSMRR